MRCVTRAGPYGTDLAPSHSSPAHPVRRSVHPYPPRPVPSRTFEDSTGTVWEVFEVHRSSHNAQAVSPGLEQGWLAFVSGSRKRRLAPFPAEWQTADPAMLEQLCQRARAAQATGFAGATGARDPVDANGDARVRAPRIRPRKERVEDGPVVALPLEVAATSSDPVEQTVRRFAHEARGRRLPAIEAMVQLKALLARVYSSVDSEARNLRAVRRWFVETYYFDRDTPESDGADQSR